MSCGQRPLLSLCSIPTVTNKDGIGGANASIYVPFLGQYFFNGGTYTFANTLALQDRSVRLGGANIATSPAMKSGCSCC